MANKGKSKSKPASKSAKKPARKPASAKGELSAEDLDEVAGGIIVQNPAAALAVKIEKPPTVNPGNLPSVKDLLL
jgi:hypothetical protein